MRFKSADWAVERLGESGELEATAAGHPGTLQNIKQKLNPRAKKMARMTFKILNIRI
jgi:hypothetical protein